ncbi:MAG TPA: serine/threonine-protein kinase [Chloroflexota bacterium]
MRELVATRYELLDRIGRGGAADVFRGRDTRLDRNVALKVLREDLTGDAEFVERFKREAKIAASLNHPNVVMVHDFGTFGDRAFIAMEYVDGISLKEQIALSGRLEAGRAADIASQVLSALAAAHARGLVHRDVKPQNVLLTRDGTAKLTDFGIAQGGAAAGLTQAGTTVGTALYMAPEQIQGGTVGPAADIYAVGVLLYEMLTGQPPFTGQSQVEVALHHLNDEPEPIGSRVDHVPPALEAAVMRALAKAPGDRFASAEDMLRALGPGGLAVDPLGATSVFATARQPRVAAAAASPAALAAEAAALGESPVAAGPPAGPWWRQTPARRVAALAAAGLLALGGVAVALGGPPELRLTRRPAALSASVDPTTAGTVLSTPADPTTASAVPATAAPGPSSLLLQRSDPLGSSGRGSEPARSAGPAAPPPASAPATSGTPAAPAPPQPSQPQSPQPAPDQGAPPPAPNQSAPAPPPRPAPVQAPAPQPQPAQAPAPAPPQPTPTSARAPTQPPATGAPTPPGPAPSPASSPAATSAPASTPAPTTRPPLTTRGGDATPTAFPAGASSPAPGLTPPTATP